MPVSPVMRQAEGRYDRPLKDVVVETIERIGTLEGTAAELQISVNTLRNWLRQWGLSITLTAKPSEPSGA